MTRESRDNATVRSSQDAPIIDADGNAWAIDSHRHVTIDGETDARHGPVTELVYLGRRVWKWSTNDGLWRYCDSARGTWLPHEGQRESPIGPDPDPRLTQVLRISGEIRAGIDRLIAGMNILSEAENEQMRLSALTADSVTALGNDTGAALAGILSVLTTLQSVVTAIGPGQPDTRIDALLQATQTIQGSITTMSETYQTAMDALNAQVAALQAQVATNNTMIGDLSTQLAAAIGSATATGATPEQIAAIQAVADQLASTVSSLQAADAAAQPTPTPTPTPTPAPGA